MFSKLRSAHYRGALLFSFALSFAVLMLLAPGPTVKRTSATTRPVVMPVTGKTIEQFIRDAYTGVGVTPPCLAVKNENAVLTALLPNTSSAFKTEARRFLSTLIQTQGSHDADPNTPPYIVETTAYSARNPVATYGFGNTTGFVTDLYHTFLQREPDSGGLAFWIAQVESYSSDREGRRLVLDAFGTQELIDLFESLTDGGPTCCPVHCKTGYFDCELGYCTE